MQLYLAKVQHFFYLAKNLFKIFLEKMYLCNILIFPSTVHTDESVAEQLTGDNV